MERKSDADAQTKTVAGLKAFSLAVVFMLAVFAVLAFSGMPDAKAEISSDVEKSNYAYIKGDYSGIDNAAKSVFYVEMYQSDEQFLGTASGFVMFDERLFVTNQHVINGASYLLIMDDDGLMYTLNQVIISDKEHDLAILYFPEGQRYNALEYDTAFDDLKRGQSILTIGSPKGMPGTVSDGIISAFPKFSGEDIRYIQITAPTSHGSSGGCLLNDDLKVIGVTSAGIDEGQNLNFAIPVFIVEQLYQQWDKKTTVNLGSEKSWDTVGYGMHQRVSGSVGKPQAGSDNSESAKVTAQPTVQPENASGGDLGLVQETVGTRSQYVVTVNGNMLDWNQTVSSAAQVCTNNGFRMIHFDADENNDAYADDVASGKMSATFLGSVAVENNFYVRKSAQDDHLQQIDISLVWGYENDLDRIIQKAQEAYQALNQRLGNPADSLQVYNEGFSDTGTNDIKKAINEKLAPLAKTTDYAFLSAQYDNLSLYIVWYDGTYTVEVTLHRSIF